MHRIMRMTNKLIDVKKTVVFQKLCNLQCASIIHIFFKSTVFFTSIDLSHYSVHKSIKLRYNYKKK